MELVKSSIFMKRLGTSGNLKVRSDSACFNDKRSGQFPQLRRVFTNAILSPDSIGYRALETREPKRFRATITKS